MNQHTIDGMKEKNYYQKYLILLFLTYMLKYKF